MITIRNQQICKVILAVAVFTGASSAFCQAQADPKEPFVRPSVEARFDFGIMTSVSHGPIPLSYRQVPHNPDDPNYSFTIPDATLSSRLTYGNVSVLPGLTFGKLTIRGGPQWTPVAFAPAPIKGTNDNTKEINQGGTTDRGYGTSLVYNAGKVGAIGAMGFVGEGDVRVYKQLSIVAGYTASKYNFSIARGYDRYDALEALDVKPYSSDEMKNPYFGLRFNADRGSEPLDFGAYLLVGPTFVRTVPIPDIGIAPYNGNSWSVRVAISVGYIRSRK